MSDSVFMQGDPATDSTRRHMERVLNSPNRRTWAVALTAGGTAWGLWRLLRAFRSRKATHAPGTSSRPPIR